MRLPLIFMVFLALCAAFTSASAESLSYTFAGGELSGPDTLAATGYAEISFQNGSERPYVLQLERLKPGKTLHDYQAALTEVTAAFTSGGDIPALLQALFATSDAVGGLEAAPGGRAEAGVLLEPGSYVVAISPECVLFCAPGEQRFLELTVQDGPRAAAPTPEVSVALADFRFEGLPAELRAGEHLWEVANTGQQEHYLVFFKLAEGTTVEALQAYLSDPNNPPGPPPAELGMHAAASGLLTGGQRYFQRFTLSPGDYAVLCPAPEMGSGMPHHALGMIQALTLR